MQQIRQMMGRLRAWLRGARGTPGASPNAVLEAFLMSERPLLREVSSQGVRVYSLCGSCGAHLDASATLCDACASHRSSFGF